MPYQFAHAHVLHAPHHLATFAMGVATTTDTTDSVRTSFEVFKNLYGMSVQVDETAKSKKEGKAAIWEKFVKVLSMVKATSE